MKYSQDAWKQFIQRLQEIPESEWRSNKQGHMIKCRKHTDLVMYALKETARNKGYITLAMVLANTCK